MNEESRGIAEGSDGLYTSENVLNQIKSSDPIKMPIIRTPEKTTEASQNSPSSVLNPPSSVKRRTIRDYFLVTP